MTRRRTWPIAKLHHPDTGNPDRAAALVFAGDIGETITVTGTVTRKGYVPSSRYGTLSTLLEIDCGTSVIVTFSQARWAQTTTIGEQVTVTGEIRNHQWWRGIPETILGRTRRIDPPPTDPGPPAPPATGTPPGKARVRRRFPGHQDPAAAPLFPYPPATRTQP